MVHQYFKLKIALNNCLTIVNKTNTNRYMICLKIALMNYDVNYPGTPMHVVTPRIVTGTEMPVMLRHQEVIPVINEPQICPACVDRYIQSLVT